jgi:AMMECR1 domain-containing protein
LNPKKYGIYLWNKNKSGVLLPNLDGVDSIDQAVDIALRKGNFVNNETFKLFKFTTTRHEVSPHVLNHRIKTY